MRLPAMLIRIAVWEFLAKTQTSLCMTGLLKMKYYPLDFVGLKKVVLYCSHNEMFYYIMGFYVMKNVYKCFYLFLPCGFIF